MNHQDLFKLLREVKNNVRCPQCGSQYDFSSIKIKGVLNSICFLELSCKNHMPLMATVMLQKTKKTNLPEVVGSNDVIETHKFLKEFQGGFESMFKINK